MRLPSLCLASGNAIFGGGRWGRKKKSRQAHRGSRQRTGCPKDFKSNYLSIRIPLKGEMLAAITVDSRI